MAFIPPDDDDRDDLFPDEVDEDDADRDGVAGCAIAVALIPVAGLWLLLY